MITPAQFLAMLDAATPEEIREIWDRVNKPAYETPEIIAYSPEEIREMTGRGEYTPWNPDLTGFLTAITSVPFGGPQGEVE